MCLEVVSLKPDNVSDQHFPILRSHPDEAGVKPVGPLGGWDGIESQYFGESVEKAVVGKEHRDGENVVGLIDRGDRDADAAAADVDGFLSELAFRLVGLKLNANGQRGGDPIKFAAVFSRRL